METQMGLEGKSLFWLHLRSPSCSPGSRVRVWHPGADEWQQHGSKGVSSEPLRSRTGVYPKSTPCWLRGRKISLLLVPQGLTSPEELLAFLGKNPVASRYLEPRSTSELDIPSSALQKPGACPCKEPKGSKGPVV